jgi:L-ascorbate 6-phosphate lactonase
MGKGEWYDIRLGKPYPVTNLRSEWFDWFLREVDGYQVGVGLTLWSIGGAGFILKSRNSTIYIDPYCGGSVKVPDIGTIHRMIPIPFNPSDVRKIDATVITHEDLDHLNEDFIFPVSENTRSLFIGPPSVGELLESWGIPKNRIVILHEYQEKKVNDVRIIGLPSNDPVPKTANTYILEADGVKVFHSGDALFFEKYHEFGKKYDIDIALISLGTNPPGMKIYNNPGEVVQIARDLGCKVLIPMHWNLWSFSLEDPYLVSQEVKLRALDIKVVILRIGERFSYPEPQTLR